MTEMSARTFRTNEAGSTRDVKAMYEAYPYPSPVVGNTLIEDLAGSFYSLFGEDSLEGKRILDAGCGTGHRLLAAARRYPAAHFVGVDMTAGSIEVAKGLMRKHRLKNVEWHVGNLLEFRSERAFDVVVATGVIHHLENPSRGLEVLASLLAEEGILSIWHYHALGEHQRLLDREMLLALWDRASGFDQGLQLLQALGLKLDTRRYGSTAAQGTPDLSQLSIDVDAYLHPIVHAYRFQQAIEMFRDDAHHSWAAINNINLPGTSKLLDLEEVERGELRYFCQSVDELFDAPSLRQRFRQLDPSRKLKLLEVKLKPTGFTIIGGRGASYRKLGARARSNVISLQ
jgi:SAM-dependent methyltransferase